MSVKKKTLTVIAVIFWCHQCAAADMLTWDDCVKDARKGQQELVSAREKVAQAQADKVSVLSGALLHVSGSAAAGTSKTQGQAKAESRSYGVSGSQLLFDGFKTANDVAAAEKKIRSAEYAASIVSSNVRLSLRMAFVDLVSAQENLSLVQNILTRRKLNRDLVALQYEGGRAHKGSLLTADANAAQAELDAVKAKRNLELCQRRLLKAMGRSSFVPVVVSGVLSAGEIDREKPTFEKIVEDTPLLSQLVVQKEAARLGIKSAQGSFFPKIYAEADAGRSDTTWPPERNNWSAGFRVSIPIFQGGENAAALSKAKSLYVQTQAEEKSGKDGVIFTLAETWTQWQNAVDQAAVQEKFYEAAQQRAVIIEAQYRSGLVTFNDWTIIEDDLVNNQKALLQAKTDALLCEAAWLQAKGETLDA